MNPELLRNVWHELTLRRLIAMPLVLGALLMLWGSNSFIADLAGGFFGIITILWGTRQAADAVAAEVTESTWDWQRLSTLTAWQLTWGKVIGATLFTWYGALICLAVRFVALMKDHDIVPLMHGTLYLICAALMAQTVSFLLGLQSVRLRGHRTRVGTLVSQGIGIMVGYTALRYAGMVPGAEIGWFGSAGGDRLLEWYGIAVAASAMATVGVVAFLGWTLLGAHRLMMRELAYRTRPWAWPAFVLFTCAFMAGFPPSVAPPSGDFVSLEITERLAIAAVTAAGLTYAALFWDDKDPVMFRRLIRLYDAKRWREFASYTPAWLVSLAITAVLAILLLAFGGGGKVGGVTLWAAIIAGLLFMARDIALNLFFWLSPNPVRANLVTLILLGLLYLVLPGVTGFDDDVLFVFYPFAPAAPVFTLCAALAQFGFMTLLLVRRWRKRFVLAAA
ncbi:hypothetical protein [Emcibacter sp. SYSU 3D8]|uniref:hypothetical protein n=1 Tax=Emcibacter sp. SYSU 3D8 TaxID=3133969 RepID=UPI0031FE8C3B